MNKNYNLSSILQNIEDIDQVNLHEETSLSMFTTYMYVSGGT